MVEYTEYTCDCDDEDLYEVDEGDIVVVKCSSCSFSSRRSDCDDCGAEKAKALHPRKQGGKCYECGYDDIGL